MNRLMVYGSLLVHGLTACLTIPTSAAASWWLPSLASTVPMVVGIVRLLVPGMAEKPPEVLDVDSLISRHRPAGTKG